MTKTLTAWLDWWRNLHDLRIDLGLERVSKVAAQLGLLTFEVPVITVAGTNGKGSTVAALEQLYVQAGYNVGCYTSPGLLSFNERVRLSQKPISDARLCQAYEMIDAARQELTLTFFEAITLAALWLFKQEQVDVVLLEVGLGGRLDATNIIDADVAVITSIALDHCDRLGDTRAAIAYEKAGIIKPQSLCVVGDQDPPVSLVAKAKTTAQASYFLNQEFHIKRAATAWSFESQTLVLNDLPYPKLLLENVAMALMVVELLQRKLKVSSQQIKVVLASLHVPGRLEAFTKNCLHIFDVAHNPASALVLNDFIKSKKIKGKVFAVFSMLVDKAVVTAIENVSTTIDYWFVAPLTVERAAKKAELAAAFNAARVEDIEYSDSIVNAYQQAFARAKPEDCIVVFGSFHTVSEVRQVVV